KPQDGEVDGVAKDGHDAMAVAEILCDLRAAAASDKKRYKDGRGPIGNVFSFVVIPPPQEHAPGCRRISANRNLHLDTLPADRDGSRTAPYAGECRPRLEWNSWIAKRRGPWCRSACFFEAKRMLGTCRGCQLRLQPFLG